MKSEWRVMSNPIGDEMRYGVYRLYDKQKVMHSGNMEIAGYYDHKEDAEKEAERRNAEEKEKHLSEGVGANQNYQLQYTKSERRNQG